MDIDINKNEFLILQEISNSKESSATSIAKKLNSSLPHTLSQLKLLEAKGIIKKEQEQNTNKTGKPKQLYEIIISNINIQLITKTNTKQKSIKNKTLKKYLSIISNLPEKEHEAFSIFYWNHVQEFKGTKTICRTRKKENEINIIAYADENEYEKRKKKTIKEDVKTANEKITIKLTIKNSNKINEEQRKEQTKQEKTEPIILIDEERICQQKNKL
jgi:DNA-binding Lrp family transcriptional regulator